MSNSPLFGIKKEIANRDPRPRVLAQPPSTACSIFNLVYYCPDQRWFTLAIPIRADHEAC
jgi:hypothetical protein